MAEHDEEMVRKAVQPVRAHVDRIIALADPEEAHSEEDALYEALMMAWLPPELWEEVWRLKEADFPRWYA